MQLNETLAIVIPVYNRAEFVARSLMVHVPLAEKYGVRIYISDNCSEDNTESVVREWMEKSPCVFYSRNESNVGAEKNFEVALGLPPTKYIWLLGDTYQLPENALGYVLELLITEQYDAIITNLNRIVSVDRQVYTDPSKMLHDLCNIISCLSCLIFSRDIIASASFSRYHGSYFIHTGIFLEYLARREFSVFWAGDLCVGSLSTKGLQKKSWVNTPRVIEIGVEKWVNFIFSLPHQYSLAAKLKAARNFGLLSWPGIARMRAEGLLTPQLLAQHRDAFALAVTDRKKYYTLFLLSRVPVTFVSWGVEGIRRWRNRNNG